MQEIWDQMMNYHLEELENYHTFFSALRQEGIASLPVDYHMIYNMVHNYLSNEVPRQLEHARGKATPSLVENVELLLNEVQKEIYPLPLSGKNLK